MKTIDQALFNQGVFKQQYMIYVGNKVNNNPSALESNIDRDDLKQEFIAKCQFMQHHARTKMGIESVTMELAATLVNMPKAASFRTAICENLFNGFMHFIVVNEQNPIVLKSLMDAWVDQGRSLSEKITVDGVEFTPLNFCVSKNNLAAFSALAQHGVDVTEVDSSGFSELHKLVDQIEKGTSSIEMLKIWVQAGLATNMVAAERTGSEYAGKTAVEITQDKGLVAITEVLGGDIELAQRNFYTQQLIQKQDLDKEFEAQKAAILENYNQKTADLKNTALKTNPHKLLLHYLVENLEQVKLPVFEKIIADKDLLIETNVVGAERLTVLELLVKKGTQKGEDGFKANQFAITLAKHGVGTIAADNGTTLLSYAVQYGNKPLFDYVLVNNLTVVDRPGRIIEKGTIKIIDSPLAYALLDGKKEMVLELVKHGFAKCTVLIPGKGEVVFGVVQSIKAFSGEHSADLIKLVSKHVEMNSEEVVQEMVNAIMKNEAEFVKALVDNGTDINYNNSELLKLFVGAGAAYLSAAKLAIQNGAKVTEDIKILARTAGIETEIASYAGEQEKALEIPEKGKIKYLLEKIAAGFDGEEVASSFQDNGKYVKMAQNIKSNPHTFKALCKMFNVVLAPAEELSAAFIAPAQEFPEEGIEAMGNLSIHVTEGKYEGDE
jgi:hypothetical protein